MSRLVASLATAVLLATALFARVFTVAVPLAGLLALSVPLSAPAHAEDDKHKRKGPQAARPAPRQAPAQHAAPVQRAAPRPVQRAEPRHIERARPHPVQRAVPHPVQRAERHERRQERNIPQHAARPERVHREAAPARQQQPARIAAPTRHDEPRNRHVDVERHRNAATTEHRPERDAHRRDDAATANARQNIPAARNQTAAPAAALAAPARQTSRRNAGVNAQAARQGRFGTRFANRAGRDPGAQQPRFAGRQAWRQGRHASFVAWAGPVFWPYAYADIFDYTFWPYAYDDGFWAYAYDDFVDNVFWADGGPDAGYDEAAPYAGDVTAAIPGQTPTARSRAQQQLAGQLCNDPANGVMAWPFDRIREAIRPNEAQDRLLDALERAADQSADGFEKSCGRDAPLTPPGRLAAMLDRLQATRAALQRVRPPLEAFYASLSDEQKARFNAIGPTVGRDQKPQADDAQNVAASCGEPKPGLTNLPIERITDLVKPTGGQQDALSALADTTQKALAVLQSACPDEIPQTPVGRLEAMQRRVEAMIAAAETVRPALASFYASLSSEQKARFNTMGLDQARADNN